MSLLFSKSLDLLNHKVIISKSSDLNSWDSWGVRDIAILSDENGNFVKENNVLIGYYTGSTNQGSTQMVGRAFSIDGGNTWQKDLNNPILKPSPDTWDSQVASTAWVLKKGNKYFMYYRGSSNACKNDSIGVATSDDGINFNKYINNPILIADDFIGIRNTPSTMGVLNSICDYNGDIIVLFEAQEISDGQNGQIFAAKSKDGFHFKPLNGGKPIFRSSDVRTWPVKKVCNPRLLKIGNGNYMLSFNGSWNGEWSIGLAFTVDLKTWTEYHDNPILVPRGFPEHYPFTNRLEGPCFDASSVINDDGIISCYIMSIPFGSKNHQNAVNAKLEFKINKTINDNLRLKHFPHFNESIQQIKNIFLLDSTKELGFIQTHLIQDKISSFEVQIKPYYFKKDSAIFICISNTLNSVSRGFGINLRISNNRLFLLEKSKYFNKFKVKKIFYFLFRKLLKKEETLVFSAIKYGNWKKIGSLFQDKKGIKMRFVIRENELSLFDPNSKTNKNLIKVKIQENPKIITFASYEAIANIKYN